MLRFIDIEWDPFYLPFIDKYSKHQSLSLEQALEPIVSRINQVNQYIQIAKNKCHFPSEHNLTLDESAAIFLYTMKWNNTSLYQIIKKDLSTFQSWLPYLNLFTHAVKKLPSHPMKVWRGINNDIMKKLIEDKEFILCNITSCSTSKNVIKNYLKANFSLCLIETLNGKDISVYSSIPNENEIILCPGTRLSMIKNSQDQISSHVLYLRENNNIIKDRLLRCRNSRIFSLIPHVIMLMIALSLVTIIGNLFKNLPVTPESGFNNTTSLLSIHVDIHGNRYEGTLKDGKKHGKGKMIFFNGYHYSGGWLNDMPEGEGIYIWPNGDQYKGQFKNGQRHGKGSYYFANGDNYIGDWFEDKKSGDGISTLSLGKYEGQFKDDKMHGKGTFYFTNGDRYIGDWVDDKQEGEGIFIWTDGNRFEGGFRAGKLHGKGSYLFPNGNKLGGEWIDGERVTDYGSFTWGNIAKHSMIYSKLDQHHIFNVFISIFPHITS